MKNLCITIGLLVFAASCKSLPEINPKQGTISVETKSSKTLFDSEHQSFSIHFQNKNTKNSCEVYTIKNGIKKWISPSLLANKTLDFHVATNGSVFIENFSNENIEIQYTIN